MQWISCADELPNTDDNVVVLLPNNAWIAAFYDGDYGWRTVAGTECPEPIAWAKVVLPEPALPPATATPGPWVVFEPHDDDHPVMIYGPTTMHSAICEVFANTENRRKLGWCHRKNAKLLGKSRELLEALRSIAPKSRTKKAVAVLHELQDI